ncbi:MAG: SulP family inorganic anion transporter [Chitinophagaceae bacterium]|nr:SulP family inorganic anion transporter [Chitinophagaceae bacterium]
MKNDTLLNRFLFYMNPNDGRYEDLKKGNITRNIAKDLTAGLIVAAVAIPLAMGFAMASGLRPEQGIVGGAIAGLFGALFGGSKYQVYGPTAAFIPVIAGLMAVYNHSFLVLASGIAGIILMLSALFRIGRVVERVPHSIVVGFTIGIAIVIAFSQIGEVLGSKEKVGYGIIDQLRFLYNNIPSANIFAVLMTAITFIFCKIFLKMSSFIPGPLIALAFGFIAGQTFWADKNLILIADKYGSIPTDFFVITPPLLPESWTSKVIFDLFYFAFAIYIVAAIESLLCSRMADRVANNKGIPYNPNKELWGQGMVNLFTPLFNGFPHTGALARTSVNIRLGAVSPLSGIAKFVFKLSLAAFLAAYLEKVPMACIGGILLYVASGMVKMKEIKQVTSSTRYHIALMSYTAVMVPVSGFMTAVVSAIMIYVITYRFFEKRKEVVLADEALAIEAP